MKWRSLEESAPRDDVRSLSQIYSERKAQIAKYAPVETQSIHARAIETLRAEKIAERALAIGASAPVFELQEHKEKLVSSADLLKNGKLVLIFFRGRWCPFCVAQLEAMNLVAPAIRETGATLVAISPQTVKQSFFMADQHKLKFPLLSDPGNRVGREFGLVYRVAGEQRSIYQKSFVNLPLANGDSSWELPIPATYIVGRDGTILFASANPDYADRPEPREILQAL